MQTECRILSLLEYFAEVQPIFCKVSANREQYKKNHILFYILCENGAAGFVSIPFAANKGALCSEYGKQQCYIISLLNQSSNTLSARNMPSFSMVMISLSTKLFFMRSIFDLLPRGYVSETAWVVNPACMPWHKRRMKLS